MASPQVARSAFAQEVADQRQNSPPWTRYEWLALIIITLLILTYFVTAYFARLNWNAIHGIFNPMQRPALQSGSHFLIVLEGFHFVLGLRMLVAGRNTFQ